MTETVLVTGATGNIGAKLTARLLATDSDVQLILLVRGSSPARARERAEDVLKITEPDLPQSCIRRVAVVCGDITWGRFGLSEGEYDALACRITHIVHLAASTKFNSPLTDAREVNVSGTVKVMEFAQRAHQLGKLKGAAYLSTAFVCGGKEGEFTEDDPGDGQNFSNSYELTKWEAECHVRSLMRELPITIFRPSIVVGDSHTGRTLFLNALYTPLRYIMAGQVRVLPGSPRALLDVVPVDYVADAVRHIFLGGQSSGKTYHLVASRRASCTVDEIVSHALNYVRRRVSCDAVPVIRYMSRNEYESHFEGCQGREKRVRDMLRVFEPYVNPRVAFTDTNTAAALHCTDISPEPLTDYLDNLLDYCFRSNWGRHFTMAA